jgi:hypothetical protein
MWEGKPQRSDTGTANPPTGADTGSREASEYTGGVIRIWREAVHVARRGVE